MNELYQQHILDHYRNPRNKKPLGDFDIKQIGLNPSCGDSLTLYVKFDDDDKVSSVGFEGDGCAISQASMSMLSEKILGMKKSDIESFSTKDIYEMLGIDISPAREKCAMLSLEALKTGILNT